MENKVWFVFTADLAKVYILRKERVEAMVLDLVADLKREHPEAVVRQGFGLVTARFQDKPTFLKGSSIGERMKWKGFWAAVGGLKLVGVNIEIKREEEEKK